MVYILTVGNQIFLHILLVMGTDLYLKMNDCAQKHQVLPLYNLSLYLLPIL